jgi:TRAP-type C4-dicarboxylate transport system permease small subunit
MDPTRHVGPDPPRVFRVHQRRIWLALIAFLVVGGMHVMSRKTGSFLGLPESWLAPAMLASFAIYVFVYFANSRCAACRQYMFWYVRSRTCPRCGCRVE